MPSIWNVGNGYNLNSKKVSSKLTFAEGERFTGRVVSKGDGKDITIKLSDGWQFIAELDGNVNVEDLKLVKFEVEGFENGKLKLKIVSDTSTKANTEVDENFSEIIEKENLSKDDVDILKLMVKYRIPLTKSNISQVKGLIQLNEKMNTNESYIKDFIENYIQEKGIDINSAQADLIRDELGKFFESFKNMSPEDILTFIENNIELSDENIKSFNEIFKGNSSIEKILMEIGKTLKENGIDAEFIDEKSLGNVFNSDDTSMSKEIPKDANTIAAKAYNNISENPAKKLNLMEILKTISGNANNEEFLGDKNSNSLLNRLNDNELMLLFKDADYNSSEIMDLSITDKDITKIQENNKSEFERVLSNVEGRTVKISDEQFKKINSLFENKVRDEYGMKQINNKNIEIKNNRIMNDVLRNIVDNKDIVKAEIKGNTETVKDIVKNLIAASSSKEEVYDKVMNLISNNINNFKVFNSVSDEYYYLNFPVNMMDKEYPCKLIIKDSRKDGKKIDTTNVKMVVSVKTIHLGEIDGYLTINNNSINVNLKCDNDFASILDNNKVKLSDGLRLMGLIPNITVSVKEHPADLVSCRGFFNDKFTSAIDIKV